jgi:hypothetical protein
LPDSVIEENSFAKEASCAVRGSDVFWKIILLPKYRWLTGAVLP